VFVILARDTIISGLRTIAMTEGLVIEAREFGKQKTAFQMVGIWALLVHYPHNVVTEELIDFHRLGSYFLYISVFFSILSAGDYFRSFFKTIVRASIAPA